VEQSEEGAGKRLQINFEDNGTGITPEKQEAIFEPGFTTNPGSPGLGLAVCKKIVEQHGGTIRVQSTPPEGTTFYLSFPIVGAAA
jgi:signal transduction histidine kinase